MAEVTLVKLAALEQIRADTVAANTAAITPIRVAAEAARDSAQTSATTATTQAGIATTQAALATTNGATQVALATAQAVAAQNSANASAASAATALNAQATEYLGVVAGNAVPATASVKGQYYLISSAGTSQGVTWTLGDKAVYNGTSGSWSRVTGFNAASNSYAEGIGATRDASGYLWSDGATSGRGQVQNSPSRMNLAGAPVAALVGWVHVPAAVPTGSGGGHRISTLSASTTPASWPQFHDNGISLDMPANFAGVAGTELWIVQYGTGAGGFNNRNFSHPTFRTVYGGRLVFLEVRFFAGSTNPVVRVDGVNISGSFSQTNTAGTAGVPDWLNPSTICTFCVNGFNWPSGIAPMVCWLNAHLTDAESESWRITGRPPAWVAAGGHCAALINSPTRNSDFSAGATDWTAPDGGTISVSGGQLTFTRTINNDQRLLLGGSFFREAPVVGARYRLRLNIIANTGLFRARSAGVAFANFMTDTSGTGVQSYEFIYQGQGTWLGLDLLLIGGVGGAGASFTIDDVYFERIGALSLPSVQPIPVVDDVTTIGGNQGRLVGVTPVCERRDWRIVAPTATNGNQQLLGGAVFAEPERHRIDSWVVNNTGSATRTVSLGQSSGATTYVSAASCPVGRNEITLASRFPASGQPNLWANSNGTDTLVHTITGHRVGA